MLNSTYYWTTHRSSNNMLIIWRISLKDIYMSYKLHVTYICCVIVNNMQIHFKPSRTYIYNQESIVFGHLFLRIHYLMAPPGLDPEEGLLVFRSRSVTYKPAGCVSLFSPTSIGSLFLFSFCFQLFLRIWSHLLSLGGLYWIWPKVPLSPLAI